MNLLRKHIESRQNSNFKRWRECLRPTGIRNSGECLIMGQKIVREILELHGDWARALLVPHRFPDAEISEILACRWRKRSSASASKYKSDFDGLRNPFDEPHQTTPAFRPFSVFELTDSL
ncbi:MAG: hypothetical protein K2X47_06885, partial [Bdellovibrionales bacterium]|nr:hypothetical protein [Bdellovibrionales bacterium]